MVSMSRRRVKGASSSRLGRIGVSSRHNGKFGVFANYDKAKLGVAGVMCLFVTYMLSLTLLGGSLSGLDGKNAAGVPVPAPLTTTSRLNHPDLHVTADHRDDESYNAMALDIIQTLKCHKLLNQTKEEEKSSSRRRRRDNDDDNDDDDRYQSGSGEGNSGSGEDDDDDTKERRQRRQRQRRQRRRLAEYVSGSQDVRDDDDANRNHRNDRPQADDEFGYGGGMDNDFDYGYSNPVVTGQHLFCLAAFSAADKEVDDMKDKIHCDATHTRQQTLLDLWSNARSEMPEEILLQTLQVAVEEERDLVGSTVYLWAPTGDDGLEWQLSELNNRKDVDEGGITGLTNNLGSNKLYVDVGSCLGLTSMAVALLYPGTKIVSIEAAAPNWLLQEMNWRCNDFTAMDLKQVILSGVGQNRKNTAPQMAKFMWRPHATTSTRAWTPAAEREDTDVELTIKLRPWHALLAEAGISPQTRIDVLNVDCEGCEYNLIPSLSEKDYDAISTVMGGVHWGYIPQHKKPSSQRAKETHERLCRHENFARTAKECCGFPDLAVSSSSPGEVIVHEGNDFPPKVGTVKDVAGELCDGFDAWAADNHLYDVESDWGWFQISSMAE
jgi:FkbM family methyltransferase